MCPAEEALLSFKSKIWSVGEALARPGQGHSSRRFHRPRLLRARTVTPIYMLVDKVFRHRCSCGSQQPGLKAGKSMWSTAFAISCRRLPQPRFSFFLLMFTAPPSAVHVLLLLHGPHVYRCYWDLCPLQLAMESYPLSFPMYCNWKNTGSPGN